MSRASARDSNASRRRWPNDGTEGHVNLGYFLLPVPKTFDQNPRFFGCSGCCDGRRLAVLASHSATRAGGCGAAGVSDAGADRAARSSAASALNGDVRIRRWIGHDSVGSVPATKYSV